MNNSVLLEFSNFNQYYEQYFHRFSEKFEISIGGKIEEVRDHKPHIHITSKQNNKKAISILLLKPQYFVHGKYQFYFGNDMDIKDFNEIMNSKFMVQGEYTTGWLGLVKMWNKSIMNKSKTQIEDKSLYLISKDEMKKGSPNYLELGNIDLRGFPNLKPIP